MKPLNPNELDEPAVNRIADLFKSLSDPTRVKIIANLMVGEINVGKLGEQLEMSQSAISHQLRGLRDKSIIRTRKQGREVFISLDDDHIKELFQLSLDHVCHE